MLTYKHFFQVCERKHTENLNQLVGFSTMLPLGETDGWSRGRTMQNPDISSAFVEFHYPWSLWTFGPLYQLSVQTLWLWISILMPHFWRLKPEITNMEGFQQSTCVRKATYDFADLVAGLGFSLPRSRWDKGKTFDDTVIIHEKNEITCDMFVWPRQDRIVFFFQAF